MDSQVFSPAPAGTVQVFVRQVYGRPLIYPANPAAQVAAQLAGVKTFSAVQLELLRDLGLEVQRLEDPSAAAVLS